ncbi:MAG: hypothetical protein A2Z25_12435 [Planctomycetes bacterium RBG_16_55_9]|nr:MAG: hypothetical protein A2Z25_12435 [Planctomycetes bacterium RBG_16_55_9]
MKAIIWIACAALGCANVTSSKELIFRGASDASAAAAVSEDTFIVADDENNVLRLYSVTEPGLPICSYDVTAFLENDPEHSEADIEGATRIGRRIYWITSHGRNKDGKLRPGRYRFFATDIDVDNKPVTFRPAGKPYKTLVPDLLRTITARGLKLYEATRLDAADLKKKDREKLAPKEEGLNIEGLCASADGKTLYIGLRNPRSKNGLTRRSEAIVVPLSNSDRIVEISETPTFGEPMLWNLGGLGIRSMEYSSFHKAYYIIAGGPDDDDEGGFVLYRWLGKPDENPVPVRKLDTGQRKFNPEAMVPFAGSGRLLLLSDDGSLLIKVAGPHECMEGEYRNDGTCPNKFLLDPNKKTFRALWLVP